MLLERVNNQQPRNELPDELAEIHASICCVTNDMAMHLLSNVPTRVLGWETRNSRALWRMFVRYALLTAYRQLQRRLAGSPVDAFGASSGSFRQTSIAVTTAASARRRTMHAAFREREHKRDSMTSAVAEVPDPTASAGGGAASHIDGEDWNDDVMDTLQSMCDNIMPVRHLTSDLDYDDEEDGATGGVPAAELDDRSDDESSTASASDDDEIGRAVVSGSDERDDSSDGRSHCVIS